MELKLYSRILLRRWWLILGTLTITMSATLFLVLRQPLVYEAETTSVVRPRSTGVINERDAGDAVDAIDTLSRRVEINSTYAEVASSKLVKQRAIAILDLSEKERKGLSVRSKVIPGTNVLEISVTGHDPGVVRDFANAVRSETTSYVSQLYDAFELEPLDEATAPGKPVNRNTVVNLAVGAVMGLVLGVSLVFFIEYLKEPLEEDASFNIIDAATGTFSKPYFMLRLRQELSRARHSSHGFSVALVKIDYRNTTKGSKQVFPTVREIRKYVTVIGSALREEDILAHFRYSTFALLLPDMSGETAKELIDEMRSTLGMLPLSSDGHEAGQYLRCSAGISAYEYNSLTSHDEDRCITQAVQALKEAESAAFGRVEIFAEPIEDELARPRVVEPNGMWSIREAADRSGLSASRLRTLVRQGIIWGEKLGGKWVTTEKAVNDYLEQAQKPASR